MAAGFVAGTVATAAQLILWWLAGQSVAENLFRDARLTAALVMGSSVLPPPATARWDILLVATSIHFALSVAYAAFAERAFRRLRGMPLFIAGAGYGLLIHAVNLHGFTLLFPWFAQVRDVVTLAAHLAFGMTLAWSLGDNDGLTRPRSGEAGWK